MERERRLAVSLLDRLKAWSMTIALFAVLASGLSFGLMPFVFVSATVLMTAVLVASKHKTKFPVLIIVAAICAGFVLLTQNCAVRIFDHRYASGSEGKWIELNR